MSTTITSISGLQNLPNLQNFNADWNSLVSVDLSGLTNLTTVDISDSIKLDGSGDHTLTSVNLTGCTSIQNLRLDGSDFSAGMPNLSGLTSLQYFDMDTSSISGSVDISGQSFNNLFGFDLSNNTITSIQLPEANLNDIILYDNALTETGVNNVLQWLDGSGVEGGYVDLSGGTNAVPTGNGSISKSNLRTKGWQVYVNQGPPGKVSIPASTDFDIYGDFTIEFFMKMANTDGFPRVYSFGAYPAPNAISIEGGGSVIYFWGNGSPLIYGTPGSIGIDITNGWHHIAIVGNGNFIHMYVDGYELATSSWSRSISSNGLPLTIGYGNENSSGFNGYLNNFRWTSAAVYSAPFNGYVPTDNMSPLPDTKLLIFQGTGLAAQLQDTSGHGHNATNDGANYSPLCPFITTVGSLQMGNI
jgi:hypothetical protein